MKYVALLRGINVGGKNRILKGELIEAFHDLGFNSVKTYIQSGNILFRSDRTDIENMRDEIEAILSSRFPYEAQAVIYTEQEFKSIAEKTPQGWGSDSGTRYNFIFTLDTITPDEVLSQLPESDDSIETVAKGDRVIYAAARNESRSKSVFVKLPKYIAYKHVTIRNNNTVNRINELFDEI